MSLNWRKKGLISNPFRPPLRVGPIQNMGGAGKEFGAEEYKNGIQQNCLS